ncbi:non-canonical purine NTP pyrophosphatase [Microbacteriaceae bacterium]|nr:non-canonical purine NTP pyrophosphatase [Candidatus Saccharibacteria bacterium]
MITFITGNPKKLAELEKILPQTLDITHQKLDLDEIQSLDLHEIITHKLRQAYDAIKQPIMVEDISAELESLNGLPGPFIKFFHQKLGETALYQIGADNDHVTITCTMGYYDGTREIIVDGVMEGTIVAPRGEALFGFDPIIQPDGYTQTLAELGPDIKNQISHRRKATDAMVVALKERGIC